MTEHVDQLLKSALALPDEEQLQFLAALTAAIDEKGLRPFDDSWIAEVERRASEFDAGTMTASSWEEVRARVRQRVMGGG